MTEQTEPTPVPFGNQCNELPTPLGGPEEVAKRVLIRCPASYEYNIEVRQVRGLVKQRAEPHLATPIWHEHKVARPLVC
jgi:hypothetical protein